VNDNQNLFAIYSRAGVLNLSYVVTEMSIDNYSDFSSIYTKIINRYYLYDILNLD